MYVTTAFFVYLETSWPIQVAHGFRKRERCGSTAALKQVVRLGSYLGNGTQKAA